MEQLDPEHEFDGWEYLLYIMAAAFLVEGMLPPQIHVQSLAQAEGVKAVKTFRIADRPLATIVGHESVYSSIGS